MRVKKIIVGLVSVSKASIEAWNSTQIDTELSKLRN